MEWYWILIISIESPVILWVALIFIFYFIDEAKEKRKLRKKEQENRNGKDEIKND